VHKVKQEVKEILVSQGKLDLQVLQEAQEQREKLDQLELQEMWEQLDKLVPPDQLE
jgi:hypothetical protein